MKHTVFIIASSILTALPVMAQSQDEDYFAPYDIIADHPQCNSLGEVAAMTRFDAQIPVDSSPDDRCYIFERRNGERVKTEALCSEEALAARAKQEQTPDFAARLTGHVTTCLSPGQQRVLDTAVFVDTTVDGQLSRIELPVAPTDARMIWPYGITDAYKGAPLAKIAYQIDGFTAAPRLNLDLNCVPLTNTNIGDASENSAQKFFNSRMILIPYLSGTETPAPPEYFFNHYASYAHDGHCDLFADR